MLAIEMKNITKCFPGVVANDNVNLEVKSGEIHSLLGENGTGKTTLMNILFGLYQADEGSIYINDQLVNINNPKDALKLGLGMIHQHFMLVERMSVLENIILGYEDGRFSLDIKKSYSKVDELSKKYGFNLDLNAKVADLSVGMKQRVEILKTLYRGADVIILDEPTAVLTPPEVKELLIILSELKVKGKSIIFITHKLNETMEIADRITVLRKGKNVVSVDKNDTNTDELARYMVGRDVNHKLEKEKQDPGKPIVSYSNVRLLSKAAETINLDIHSGEILGIAGVEGNGQMELEEISMGLRNCIEGEVFLEDRNITKASTMDRKKMKMGYIPSDRYKRAMFVNFSISENMLLGYHNKSNFSKKGIINLKFLKEYTENLIKQFEIKANCGEQKIGKLSGGNQQKVILAREISQDPIFILAAQPSRGLDIGAMENVHNQLLKLRNEGKAILLISADLNEVMELSDRIAVLYEGEIVALRKKDDFQKEEIGLLMAGKRGGDSK